jgi:hypothetical protein
LGGKGNFAAFLALTTDKLWMIRRPGKQAFLDRELLFLWPFRCHFQPPSFFSRLPGFSSKRRFSFELSLNIIKNLMKLNPISKNIEKSQPPWHRFPRREGSMFPVVKLPLNNWYFLFFFLLFHVAWAPDIRKKEGACQVQLSTFLSRYWIAQSLSI